MSRAQMMKMKMKVNILFSPHWFKFRFHEDYLKQCHKTVTQEDFDCYYLKHFELIKKQICERKSLDKEKRRAEEESGSSQHSKSIKSEADGNPSASGTVDKGQFQM